MSKAGIFAHAKLPFGEAHQPVIAYSSPNAGSVPGVDPSATCPGNNVTLGLDQNVTLVGTTVGGTDSFKEWCGDTSSATSSPDVVYQVTLPETCSLTIRFAETSAWDGAVIIRPANTCGSENMGSDTCMNGTTAQGEFFAWEFPAGTYSVIVDGGSSGQAGSYALDLICATPACGDGILNTGEQCDTGATDPSGVCGGPTSAHACQIAPLLGPETCARASSVPIHIAPGATLIPADTSLLYDSLSGTDEYAGSCSTPADPGMGAPEQIFQFVPDTDGTLSVTIGQDASGNDYCQYPYMQPECFIHTMWFRESDCDTGTELACVQSNVVPDNDVNTLSIQVKAGNSYYLFVEGDSSSNAIGENGPYLLNAVLN
jgi:hypothetical protein